MAPLNRRQFAQSLGVALGGAVALPELLPALTRPQHTPRDADGAIQLDSNENPYGPSPAARDAITASETVACRYPDVSENHIVAAIAKFYGVPTNQVLIGCGSTEILRCADMAFLASGKSAIAAEPTFETVLGYAQVMHANPIKVAQTPDHRHDLPAMAKAVTPNAGLVYVCNPNNPTGTIVSLQELDSFLKAVPPQVLVLVDEAYFDFVTDPSYGSVISWIPKYPNLIVARTFSKVFGMAGMRLGYAIGSPASIAAMRTYKLSMNGNVAVLKAGLVSLGDQAHVTDQRQKMISTRSWLCAELERDKRTYIPSHANFVMIDVKGDVSPVIAAFRQRNVLVGRKFPSMGNWLRITIGTPAEMQAFMTGLREIVPVRSA